MKRVSGLMHEYLRETNSRPVIREIKEMSDTTVPDDLPIRAKQGGNWDMLDEPTQRLRKSFKFDDKFRLVAFINEVIEYQDEISHHGKIVIEGDKVTISVYTHRVNLVTEIDMEYAKSVDEIYDDVEYFSERDSFE